jgi:SMC interacting uncharacterized protein involved in chromosome segregation
MATKEEIQGKVTEHELQCKKIDEAAKDIIEKIKGMQESLAGAQKSLRQLNDMKLARLGALDALKSLTEEGEEDAVQ